MWRRASAFAVALLTGIVPVAAQQSSLAQAERLFLADDIAAARDAASIPESQDDETELRRLWVVALSHMRESAPRLALPHLERLVTLSPETARFRLELARALYLVEDDDRARHHFDHALAGELSLSEIATVNEYLRAMDGRKPWKGHMRVAVVRQSNPFHRSGESHVSIGGHFLLPLPDVESARGAELGLGATYLPKIGSDLHLRLHAMATGQFFENSDLNRWHLRSEIGLLALGDHDEQISGGVSVQGAFDHSGNIMRGIGVYAGYRRQLHNRTRLAFHATADRLTYPTSPALNGPRYTFSVQASRILSPRMAMHGGVSLMHHRTESLHNQRSTGTLTIGGQYAFRGGVQGGLEASISRTHLKAANPLLFQYGPERSTAMSLTARVMHRDYTVRGFAPVLVVGYAAQNSNVPIQAHDNFKLTLEATRNF